MDIEESLNSLLQDQHRIRIAQGLQDGQTLTELVPENVQVQFGAEALEGRRHARQRFAR